MYILTLWEENYLFPSLHGSAFYRALIWLCWDYTAGSHGLWLLRGHLQTLALFDNHESASVCPAVAVGLDWWILHVVVNILFTHKLPFCGPNVFDHFICDMYTLLKLACTDTHIIGLIVVANDGIICVVLFTFLLISYGVILHSLKNVSQEKRCKALSTYGSHIPLVPFFFVPCIFLYVSPPSILPIDKCLAVFYTIITPMLNSLICTLRNGEMQNAMKNLWAR